MSHNYTIRMFLEDGEGNQIEQRVVPLVESNRAIRPRGLVSSEVFHGYVQLMQRFREVKDAPTSPRSPQGQQE